MKLKNKFTRFHYILMFLLLVLTLTSIGGCGGCNSDSDDDDDDDDNNAVNGADDDSSGFNSSGHPVVLYSSPAIGDIEIRLMPEILIAFSDSMDSEAVEASFSISDGSGTSPAGSFSWDDSGKQMTFIPSSTLAENSLYECELGTGAKDQQGRQLAEPYAFTFTTVDLWTFDVAEIIGINGLVMDRENCVYALEYSYYDTHRVVKLNYHGSEVWHKSLQTYNTTCRDMALGPLGWLHGIGYRTKEVYDMFGFYEYNLEYHFIIDPNGILQNQWALLGSEYSQSEGYSVLINSERELFVGRKTFPTITQRYVYKESASGDTLWTYENQEQCTPKEMVMDDDGNLYIVGECPDSDTAWFAKVDSMGNEVFQTVYPKTWEELDGIAVAVDSQGYSYNLINVHDSLMDLYGMIIVQYDPNGNRTWTKEYSPKEDEASEQWVLKITGGDLTVDSQDNLIVTGAKWGELAHGGIFVTKYSREGDLLWEYIGTSNSYKVRGYQVVADSYDNVIAAGRFYDDNSEFYGRIRKFDPDGNYVE